MADGSRKQDVLNLTQIAPPCDWKISFHPSRSKALGSPNSAYPSGTHRNLAEANEPSQYLSLPQHPAPSVGMWRIRCEMCGATIWTSVRGLNDDPQSVSIGCGAKVAASPMALGQLHLERVLP